MIQMMESVYWLRMSRARLVWGLLSAKDSDDWRILVTSRVFMERGMTRLRTSHMRWRSLESGVIIIIRNMNKS